VKIKVFFLAKKLKLLFNLLMLYRIFTLHPDIFPSFLSNGLIARGIAKNIIKVETINWREKYGVGNYRQVDDKPFGGGSGMVLMCEPIYQALKEFNAISSLYIQNQELTRNKTDITLEDSNQSLIEFINELPENSTGQTQTPVHARIIPNNSNFEDLVNQSSKTDKPIRKATIYVSPRGYPLTQRTAEWMAQSFDELNILCGRYEGFDARVNELIDMELSIGNFVTNGGEAPAMCMIEAVSRLIPDFVTKGTSVAHDSFSSSLNEYQEQMEYVIGKRNLDKMISPILEKKEEKIFNNQWWIENVLPHIEHPQYTRPTTWEDISVPPVLLSGDHKKIQKWRVKWY
jgi:tRNA (guanine37-N1)-methyltransferase